VPEGKNEARKKYKFGEIPFCGQVQKSNFSTFCSWPQNEIYPNLYFFWLK